MRGRTTRHGRVERNRRLNARVSPRDVAVVYAAMVLVPVLLWVVANPVLGVGLAVLMGVGCVMVQLGRRVVLSLLRARRAT